MLDCASHALDVVLQLNEVSPNMPSLGRVAGALQSRNQAICRVEQT